MHPDRQIHTSVCVVVKLQYYSPPPGGALLQRKQRINMNPLRLKYYTRLKEYVQCLHPYELELLMAVSQITLLLFVSDLNSALNEAVLRSRNIKLIVNASNIQGVTYPQVGGRRPADDLLTPPL
uniref:Uncharacterized protein n=1 Tax=Knipowitschia caucasica TaxID=637954 RepID=A0AAV2J1C6_KNICA